MKTIGKLVNVSHNLLTGKTNLTFETETPVTAQIDDIKDENRLAIEVVKYREKRSLDANALLWHCIGQLAAAMTNDKWNIYLLMLKRYGKFTYVCIRENAVEAMKRQWRECEVVGEVTINGQKAVQLLCYYGSSTYNTQEFSALLEGVISEMKEAGLEPPMPAHVKAAMERYEKEWQKRQEQEREAECQNQ